MSKYYKFIQAVSNWYAIAGSVLLIAVFSASVADIVGTKLLSMPVRGICEIVGYSQAIFIALAAGLAQIARQHIRVETLISRLPRRAHAVFETIVYLILLGFFAILVWRIFLLGRDLQESGQLSETLFFHLFYIPYIMAFGFILPCFILVWDIFNSIKEIRMK